MSHLNHVTLSTDGKIASVGPGLRWGEVTAALEAKGAAVAGGRDPSVGVGGLLLGGGYHYTSGAYGLAADNVHNFEIVLGDGSIQNVNAAQNPDLFWALKGGGPNFGVVTRYDLNTIPIKKVWSQLNAYVPTQADDILDAFFAWQNTGASDLKSAIALDIGLHSIIVGFLYFEEAPQMPDAFKAFANVIPLQVAVPAQNSTFAMIDQITGKAFANPATR